MKSEHQQRVEQFMRLAKQDVPEKPTEPNGAVLELRAKLILEEAFETIEAMGVEVRDWADSILTPADLRFERRDHLPFCMEEVIDGCCDLMVVTTGTLSACGVPDEPFLEAVDQNNLDKFGPGHSWRADGKLQKPPGHQPPDLRRILESLTA